AEGFGQSIVELSALDVEFVADIVLCLVGKVAFLELVEQRNGFFQAVCESRSAFFRMRRGEMPNCLFDVHVDLFQSRFEESRIAALPKSCNPQERRIDAIEKARFFFRNLDCRSKTVIRTEHLAGLGN